MTTRFHNLRLADGTPAAIVVRDGAVVEVGADDRTPVASSIATPVATVDLDGCLVLPGLVDGHVHLDKTLLGLPWLPHPAGPDRESRIETEKRIRERFPAPVSERATNLVRTACAFGTRALRTHVDVDPAIGLASLHAVLEVRERFAGLIDIQIVAFPQSGIVRSPGTAELLDAAIADGADLVGGIDPLGYDGDLDGHLDAVFGIAERRGVGVDLHIHTDGAQGLVEIEAVVDRARALGLGGEGPGRATVSHGFALGSAAPDRAARVAAQMAAAGVSLATHGAGAAPMPPLRLLREHGVIVFAGNDNVRDAWSPYSTVDMLERAMLVAWRSGLRTDADLEVALSIASDAGATALGLPAGGPVPGARADFCCVAAENAAEAVVDRPPRTCVVKAGRVVARGGALV